MESLECDLLRSSTAAPHSEAEADPVGLKPEALRQKACIDEKPLRLNPLHCSSPCPKRALKCPTTNFERRFFP